jgi:L-ascorbate metabolism protein UlaG (beta-lactamase superfamily)
VSARIAFHGVACFEVIDGDSRFLIDPFLSQSPAADVGPDELETPVAILVTHAAFDHVGDAAAIALRTGAPIVCGVDVAALMREAGVPAGQIRTTVWGLRVRFGDAVVNPVECRHWSHATLTDGTMITGEPMGFVVSTGSGVAVYHYGDTALFGDLSLIGKLHRPLVGLIGCSQPWSLVQEGPGEVLTGEMSPEEAAMAAELLGVRYAVGCHYETPDHRDIEQFVAATSRLDTSGRRVPLALSAGQTLVVDGDDYFVEG